MAEIVVLGAGLGGTLAAYELLDLVLRSPKYRRAMSIGRPRAGGSTIPRSLSKNISCTRSGEGRASRFMSVG